MKDYNVEKEKMKLMLSRIQSRVAITTDMWTATNQNRGYMTCEVIKFYSILIAIFILTLFFLTRLIKFVFHI